MTQNTKEYNPSPAESEAIRLFNAERANWQDGQAFVTDDVQYIMRNVVKKARKNFYGIYNQEFDPITRRRKIFIPFTEWVCETMLKNIDIDTKDIDVKAQNSESYFAAQLYRYILKKKLDDVEFGETLNRLLRNVVIDGTGFLKSYDVDGKLRVDIVDRLNLVYDPSARSLDESSGIQERFVLPLPEFRKLKLPNSEYVEGDTTIDRIDTEQTTGSDTTTEIPYVEVYERYGYLPKFAITGKEKDRDEYIYTKATISGINKETIVHKIEEVDGHPFGEFKLKEVPNRMDGRGVPEMLFDIQAYLNETVNLRMNKARVVQMGLFKIRGNVTPQQFRRLFATSAIKLDEISDVDRIDTGSIDQSSYNDEEKAYQWGTRVTGTTQEDEVAGNRPATNALLQQQGVSKGYNLRMEGLFINLAKFIEQKMMPIINRELKKEKIVRISGSTEALEKLDERLVKNKVYADIANMTGIQRLEVSPEVMAEMIREEMEELKEMGEDRYIEMTKELFDPEYNIKIVIGDEEMNKAVIAQSLISIMNMLAQAGMPTRDVMRELFDTLGLPADKLIEKQPEGPPQPETAETEEPTLAGGLPENLPTPNPTA